MERGNQVNSKYSNITYDRASGKIEGKTNMGVSQNMYLFSASVNLLAVSLAMEIVPQSITQFMNLADGYGEAGLFPSGYDWSGIRDSSDMSKTLMSELAQTVLAPHTKRLAVMGLPAALVADLTGAV
jgi:hypothetical protein